MPFSFLLSLLSLWASGSYAQAEPPKPNVILIMADDMGYECLSAYGSLSYSTPNLDRLAANGIRFEQCISQPLCTPSRVKIMTGQYNYRNYEYFGYLNTNQHTIGHLMREAGYATCIAGKWQLNGISYKDQIEDWADPTRPNQLGFDEYCLWQLTHERREGERYANPLIEQNGELLPRNEDSYGPDVFAQFVLDFIGRNKKRPFFVYYPMVLVHDPFVPTPDSESWEDKGNRYRNDTAYFKDMVAYTDKIVGQITSKLKEDGLLDHTILLFTGDNGTHRAIYTHTTSGIVQGGKAKTTDAGTRVPLIAHWPEGGQSGVVYEELIEFSDFYPTLAELAGNPNRVDGQSFLPVLTGATHTPRRTAFVHYDPQWGSFVNQFRNQFVRTLEFKLYADGRFYNLRDDLLEQRPLNTGSLSAEEREVLERLQKEMEKHPEFDFD